MLWESYWNAIDFIASLDRRYNDNQEVGWVYAMRNPEFRRPLLKIGMTRYPPHERAQTLATTGVPGSYEVVYFVHVVNRSYAEQCVHDALAKYRFQPNKEFFEAPIREVVAVMDQVAELMPIRRSQGRSGYYNQRSAALPQVFSPVDIACSGCGRVNRVRPLAIRVTPVCARCRVELPALPGIESLGAAGTH